MEIEQDLRDIYWLSAIINSSEDAIISKNLEGVITSWNPAAERIFGYTEHEAVGRHITLIAPPELHDEEQELINRIKQGERINHFETTRVRKDGERVNISLTISPIKNSAGEVIGASKIARDITEQKKGEEKQAMLASIVGSSDDIIISKDLNGTITSWNKTAEKLLGYTAEEAIGKHITMIIPDHLLDEEDMIISRVKSGRRIEHFETMRQRKDGTLINLSITVSPIKDATGRIVGASKIARDISGQKKAEERQALLAAIVDSSDDIIVSKNLNGIITSWNKAAERVFGYSEEEMLGQSIMKIIPADRTHEENLIISKIKKGESIDHFETIRQGKKGKKIPVSITVSPIRERNGLIIGASKIARDITDRIEIERKLKRQTERLQQLNRAKDEFISMASHELKTPLTSITAYLQLLQRNLKSEVDKVYVDKTLTFVSKLTRLVSDLLDVSKIQAGKLQLNYTTFNMEHLLDECIESMRHTSKTHEVIREGEPANIGITGDRQRIEQVLMNYLTNAIKYSPKADRVIVSTKVTDTDVTVGVKDFGIGIPPEEQEKVFSRFYRVEGLNPGITGLGIGLYISAEIVLRHNGKVWVESEEGLGSTFYFSIPLRQQLNG